MDDQQWLAERFEQHRARLRAVAYRMLGSLSEADDAVQESWLRLARTDTETVQDLGAWLTTIVARVSLNMLRARRSRREEPVGVRMPDPIVSPVDHVDPEQQALLADSVGMAMLIVLETLSPAERLAVVLHDMFAVPFEEIAAILGQTTVAVRQVASRARRRLRAAPPASDTDLARQRTLVDAFLAAAREGHIDRLLDVLHPEVVLRTDASMSAAGGSRLVQGAHAVAKRARAFSRTDRTYVPAQVNAAAGVVSFHRDRPVSVLCFTIIGGKIVEIDILADPARLAEYEMPPLHP